MTSTTDEPYDPDLVTLTTLGVDVGSASTQLLFSRLSLRRRTGELSSQYDVVARDVLYRSPVHLTPFGPNLVIDQAALTSLVDAAFVAAGITPEDVDTGAVLTTGEATRRHNAQAVAESVAGAAGNFICVTAGHHLEARLAAQGSGAVEASAQRHARVLNIDIGGGTTKLTVVEDGVVIRTAALHVGGRLIAVDDEGCIARIEPICEAIAASTDVAWSLGARADDNDLRRVAAAMADAVVAAVRGEPLPSATDDLDLWLTEPIPAATYEPAILSGGVAEYVFKDPGKEAVTDLGPWLGTALRARLEQIPGPVRTCAEPIRSTVFGASQYTVQVSGNTIYVADPEALPVWNASAIRLTVPGAAALSAADLTMPLDVALASRELNLELPVAVMIEWHGPPSFTRLAVVIDALTQSLKAWISSDAIVCLAFDADLARAAGQIFADRCGRVSPRVVAVDGMSLGDFEYVDIGPVDRSGSVPVTIKSLLFGL